MSSPMICLFASICCVAGLALAAFAARHGLTQYVVINLCLAISNAILALIFLPGAKL